MKRTKKKKKKNSPNNTNFQRVFPTRSNQASSGQSPRQMPLEIQVRFQTLAHIIDDPDFICMHRNLCNKNFYQKHRQISTIQLEARGLAPRGLCFTTRSSDSFRRLKFSQSVKVLGNIQPRASVDGLVLITAFIGLGGLRLWNPFVRRSLRLPPFPLEHNHKEVYSLGYDPLSNDYKAVVFQFKKTQSNSESAFAIYGLNEGCWRRSTKGMDSLAWDHCDVFSESFVHQGVAYWILNTYLIISSDFSDEEVRLRELPDKGEAKMVWLLGVSVALLGVSDVDFGIWVMAEKDGGKENWSKWYLRCPSLDEYNFFLNQKHGKVLYDEKNSVFLILSGGEVRQYNIRSRRRRQVGKSVIPLGMYVHAESLLLWRGVEAQSSSNFWH